MKRKALFCLIISLFLISVGCASPKQIQFEAQYLPAYGIQSDADKGIIKLLSLKETQEFYASHKDNFNDLKGDLQKALKYSDEEFFKSHILLVWIKYEGSISIKHEVRSVRMDKGKVIIQIHRIIPEGRDDMIWYDYIVIAIDKRYAHNEFSVEFN